MPRRALIVDDDGVITSLMSFVLKNQNYEVQTAEDAEAGLALLQAENFDILFTDLRLPGINGLAIAAAARAWHPAITIILMTATGADRIPAIKSGGVIDDVVIKPFTLKDVQSVLDRHGRTTAANSYGE